MKTSIESYYFKFGTSEVFFDSDTPSTIKFDTLIKWCGFVEALISKKLSQESASLLAVQAIYANFPPCHFFNLARTLATNIKA